MYKTNKTLYPPQFFKQPFINTGRWTIIFLVLVVLLRFGHLLRGLAGATLAFSAQLLALFIVVFFITNSAKKQIGLGKFSPKWWFISIGGGLIAGSALALFNRFFLPVSWDWILAMDTTLVPQALRELPLGLTETFLALVGAALTPISEELFFRGLLLNYFSIVMNNAAGDTACSISQPNLQCRTILPSLRNTHSLAIRNDIRGVSYRSHSFEALPKNNLRQRAWLCKPRLTHKSKALFDTRENSLGIFWAVVVQALIFAFMHLAHVGVEISPNPSIDLPLAANIFISTFLGGIAFAYIRIRSSSIWPSVLAHAAVNIAVAIF